MNDTHYVYRCYDAAGALLYIGCTQYPEKRIDQHRAARHWSTRIETVTFAGPYDYFVGLAIERNAIRTELPLFNIQWNPRFQTVESHGIGPELDTAAARRKRGLIALGLPA
ncbi:MAG TPA: GIY-YIG nuclease family protein [Galbitalea sp.]|jgi:hypothetical protein